jgi:4-nitrophenyl phosphatase
MDPSPLTSGIKALILDMDGVLWRGSQPIGDLMEVFTRIQRLRLATVLATNNSTRTPEQVLEKLARFGVLLRPRQIISSAMAAAYLLKQRFPQGGPVYAVGEDGLVRALAEQGFDHHDPPHPESLAVVAGLDRGFSYHKLKAASGLIRSGAVFLGTNPDPTYPAPSGLDPGAGSILAAITAASGAAPLIAGKPQPHIYKLALERLESPPEAALVVGDRLDTDMSGAFSLGCPTALVLSGVTTSEQALKASPAPNLVAPDLEAVVSALERAV